MFGINNKRGDTNWFIVSMILVLATLVIFAIAFGFFPWKQTIDRESCKVSILLRGSLGSNSGGGVAGTAGSVADGIAKDAINLRCKSRNICVTMKTLGRGECDDFKEFDTIRVSGDKLEVERKIKMFLAQEMADCWNMFGEGNLEIFSRSWKSFLKDVNTQGIICSRIRFDDTILNGKDGNKNTADDVQSVDGFMKYLVSHKVPENNISYMDYLTGNPDGESANLYYGGIIKNGGTDSVSLDKIKTIFYVETTQTNAGKVWAAGTFGVLGTVFGAKAGLKGAWLGARVGGVIGIFTGDFFQKVFTEELPNGRNSLPGIFLADYDVSSFNAYNIDSFENVA